MPAKRRGIIAPPPLGTNGNAAKVLHSGGVVSYIESLVLASLSVTPLRVTDFQPADGFTTFAANFSIYVRFDRRFLAASRPKPALGATAVPATPECLCRAEGRRSGWLGPCARRMAR